MKLAFFFLLVMNTSLSAEPLVSAPRTDQRQLDSDDEKILSPREKVRSELIKESERLFELQQQYAHATKEDEREDLLRSISRATYLVKGWEKAAAASPTEKAEAAARNIFVRSPSGRTELLIQNPDKQHRRVIYHPEGMNLEISTHRNQNIVNSFFQYDPTSQTLSRRWTKNGPLQPFLRKRGDIIEKWNRGQKTWDTHLRWNGSVLENFDEEGKWSEFLRFVPGPRLETIKSALLPLVLPNLQFTAIRNLFYAEEEPHNLSRRVPKGRTSPAHEESES